MQNMAFISIGIGILILIGYFVKDFFLDGEIRIAVGAIGAGILVLIGLASKGRRAQAKTENFKGVER